MSESENLAAELRDIEVLTTSGDPIRLGSLWQKRAAVLVFIRHFG